MWAAGGGAASKLYTCRSQGISCSTHTHMLLSRMHQADMFPESARYFFQELAVKHLRQLVYIILQSKRCKETKLQNAVWRI